jgi:hypothetical protein
MKRKLRHPLSKRENFYARLASDLNLRLNIIGHGYSVDQWPNVRPNENGEVGKDNEQKTSTTFVSSPFFRKGKLRHRSSAPRNRSISPNEMVNWKLVSRLLMKIPTSRVKKSDFMKLTKELSMPKPYSDILLYCTKTYKKLRGSKAKYIYRKDVHYMLMENHRILFSSVLFNSIRRGYGRKIREQIRSFIKAKLS